MHQCLQTAGMQIVANIHVVSGYMFLVFRSFAPWVDWMNASGLDLYPWFYNNLHEDFLQLALHSRKKCHKHQFIRDGGWVTHVPSLTPKSQSSALSGNISASFKWYDAPLKRHRRGGYQFNSQDYQTEVIQTLDIKHLFVKVLCWEKLDRKYASKRVRCHETMHE